MPDYLSEADWKRVLNQPKNLGLKAQKTGISEKLRDYSGSNNLFENKPDRTLAQITLKAVQALKNHANSESSRHPAFTDATRYLRQIVAAARERERELEGKVDELEEALEKEHDRKDVVRDFAHDLITIVAKNENATTLEEVAAALDEAETLLTNAKKTESKAGDLSREVKKASTIVEGLVRTRKNQLPDKLEAFTAAALETAKDRAGLALKHAKDGLINTI